MITRNWIAYLTAVIALLLSLSAQAEPNPAPSDLAPVRDLAALREEIATVQAELDEVSKKMWRMEHDLEYENEDAATLRREVKKLEKDVLQMKKQIKVRATLSPELVDAERARRRLFEGLRELKEEERAIRREIATIKAREAMSK